QVSLAQGPEAQLAALPIADPAALDEGPLPRDLHLGLERGARSGLHFRLRLDALGGQPRSQDLPARRRLSRQLALRPLHRTCLALELQREDELSHAWPSPSGTRGVGPRPAAVPAAVQRGAVYAQTTRSTSAEGGASGLVNLGGVWHTSRPPTPPDPRDRAG